MTYNGNSQIFCIVHVEIDFLLSGLVKKEIHIDSVNLELAGRRVDQARMVMEALVAVAIVFTLIGEFAMMRSSTRDT